MTSDVTTPRTLIGHQQRWAAVQRAYARGKIPQTLMISGPSHLGKRTFARRLSQLLLCPQASPDNPYPCGTCRVCHQIEIETFPDYKVYRPLVGASEKDVRDRNIAPRDLEGSIIPFAIARDFGAEAMMKPLVGKRKVMLIESADRLSIEAQNALLKTFEEPVNGLSIVLLCDNPGALLSTVLSRAWHLPLGLASDAEIGAWLREQFPTAEPMHVQEALRSAAGRPGAAYLAVRRLSEEDAGALSRFAQAQQFVTRIGKFGPVGALALSEEAAKVARQWWDEDQDAQNMGTKSEGGASATAAKITRTALARFLDELGAVYRAQWSEVVAAEGMGARAQGWERGLDLIRKTRQYILRNANGTLALDVLFGRLIALRRSES